MDILILIFIGLIMTMIYGYDGLYMLIHKKLPPRWSKWHERDCKRYEQLMVKLKESKSWIFRLWYWYELQYIKWHKQFFWERPVILGLYFTWFTLIIWLSIIIGILKLKGSVIFGLHLTLFILTILFSIIIEILLRLSNLK